MRVKRVMIDGAEYVPLSLVHFQAPLRARRAAKVLTAAFSVADAVDAVDEHGGLEVLDQEITRLKQAVRAFELDLLREESTKTRLQKASLQAGSKQRNA